VPAIHGAALDQWPSSGQPVVQYRHWITYFSTMPSWDGPLKDWRRVVHADLKNVYCWCRAAVARMRERDYGGLVNVKEKVATAAWLVSEENSFTTGAVFDLSGDRAAY